MEPKQIITNHRQLRENKHDYNADHLFEPTMVVHCADNKCSPDCRRLNWETG